MMTAEELDRIERYAHPRTKIGKETLKLIAEIRGYARDYNRQGELLRSTREYAAALESAAAAHGLRVEVVDAVEGSDKKKLVSLVRVDGTS